MIEDLLKLPIDVPDDDDDDVNGDDSDQINDSEEDAAAGGGLVEVSRVERRGIRPDALAEIEVTFLFFENFFFITLIL